MKPPYKCPCCGYETEKKSAIIKHFYNLKKLCPKLLNDIELTDEIKEYILANRIYIPNNNNNHLITRLANLTIENAILKNRKDEKFYQAIVEKYLGSTHHRIKSGITDVSTDTIHAEIKRWNNYKDAIGQLTSYNITDPKEELHVYMFDKCSKTALETALMIFKQLKYKIHEFNVTDDKVEIIDYDTKNIIYTHIIFL